MGCSSSSNVELSNEDLQFIKTHTSYDDETIKQWYKGFLNDCPTGQLNKSKFLELYKMFFSSGNPDKFCEHVFRTFDTDENGFIDFKEFLLAVGVTSSQSAEERLRWAFRMYDINGDGLIEHKEMKKIVSALYEMLGSGVEDMPIDTPDERVAMIFEKIDTNRDGCVSLQEFLTGCMDDPKLSRLLSVNAEESKRYL